MPYILAEMHKAMKEAEKKETVEDQAIKKYRLNIVKNELFSIQQGKDTIPAYIEKFNKLTSQLPQGYISDEVKKDIFILRLNQDIKNQVVCNYPETYADAVESAMRYGFSRTARNQRIKNETKAINEGIKSEDAKPNDTAPKDRFQYICYRCKQRGHVRKECPDKPAKAND